MIYLKIRIMFRNQYKYTEKLTIRNIANKIT